MGKKDYEGCGVPSLGSNIRDKDYQRKQLIQYMFARTQRMFKYNGLPENIPQREVEKLLQYNGWCVFYKTDDGILRVDRGGFSGVQNEYYLPTEVVVTNPYLNVNKTFTIGKDCVVVKNDSYYLGLAPLFNKYAEMICTNDITMYNVDILARIQALLKAGDSNGRKQAQAYLDSVMKGELSFVHSNAFVDNIQEAEFAAHASDALTNLIEYQQYLKGSWLSDIGIKSTFNMKREAIMAGEAENDGDYLLPFIDDMKFNRDEGYEQVKEVLGETITIEKDSSWEDIENRESIESEADAERDDAKAITEEEGKEEPEEEKKDED